MKSSIPSVAGSTRELMCAAGGCSPWTACASTGANAPSGRKSPGRALALGADLGGLRDDVLDGHLGRVMESLDQVSPQPRRAGRRERRDDDLIDPLVLDRLHRRRVRVRMSDLAVRLDSLTAQDGERPP